MKTQTKNKAFTLVELIVVITILAILGTIAFISFQGYSRDSRDSVRISDMNNIEKAMELILLKGSKLPLPEDNINLTASGELIGYQGYVGLDSLNKIGINNGGLDPLDDSPYTYVTTKDLNKYQILGFLEQDTTSSINSLNLLENTYSADYSSRFPIVKGNNLGVLLSSGSLEPISVDVDVVLNNNDYIVYLSNKDILTGTGIETSKLELSYNNGIKGSCALHLRKNKSLKGKDGLYLINPNGGKSFKVYCDMTTDGGGWTLFLGGEMDKYIIGKENFDNLIKYNYIKNKSEFMWHIQNLDNSLKGLVKIKFNEDYDTWFNGHTGGDGIGINPTLDSYWYVEVPEYGVLYNYTKNTLVRAVMYGEINDGFGYGLHYKRTSNGEHFPWFNSNGGLDRGGYLCRDELSCGYDDGGGWLDNKKHSLGFR